MHPFGYVIFHNFEDIVVRCFPSMVKMAAAFPADVLVSAGSIDYCRRWYDIVQRQYHAHQL